MRRLTLIRHGITTWNLSGKFMGHSDLPLSPDGQKQAQALAKHWTDPVDLIYASPLKRAFQTAETLFPNRRIRTDARLKELNFGVFEGYTQAENEQHEAWDAWFSDPYKRRPPGGESYEELRERAAAWMDELPEAEHIVAVAHAGTIRMLISHVLGLEHPRWRKRIFLRHTSLTSFVFRDGETVIERVNDDCHLRALDLKKTSIFD